MTSKYKKNYIKYVLMKWTGLLKPLFHVSWVNITYRKSERRFGINSILIFTVFSAENTVHMHEVTKKIYPFIPVFNLKYCLFSLVCFHLDRHFKEYLRS